MERKRPIKAQFEADIASSTSELETTKIEEAFAQRQSEIETALDNETLDFHLSLGVSYNVRPRPPRLVFSRPPARCSRVRPRRVQFLSK